MSNICISPTGSNESSSVTALLQSAITWSHELRNYDIHNTHKLRNYGIHNKKNLRVPPVPIDLSCM